MEKNLYDFYDAVADMGAGAEVYDTEKTMQSLMHAYNMAMCEQVLTPKDGYDFEDVAARLGFTSDNMPKCVHVLNYQDGQVAYVTFRDEY